jgi:hypothetical protein
MDGPHGQSRWRTLSGTTLAVFISYASQDAKAAQRICAALRAAEIEVWFDQSDLRGGDAWDAAIRKQVAECALFMPIISANTDARSEGYFRREWNLAVNRMLDMAQDQSFLVPEVIDDTPETTAHVPDRSVPAATLKLVTANRAHLRPRNRKARFAAQTRVRLQRPYQCPNGLELADTQRASLVASP